MSAEPEPTTRRVSARRLRMARVYAVLLMVLGASVFVRTIVVEISDHTIGVATGFLVGIALLAIGVMRWLDLRRLS